MPTAEALHKSRDCLSSHRDKSAYPYAVNGAYDHRYYWPSLLSLGAAESGGSVRGLGNGSYPMDI